MASYRDGGTNSYIRSDGHGYADGDVCADDAAYYQRADVQSGADFDPSSVSDPCADGDAWAHNKADAPASNARADRDAYRRGAPARLQEEEEVEQPRVRRDRGNHHRVHRRILLPRRVVLVVRAPKP